MMMFLSEWSSKNGFECLKWKSVFLLVVLPLPHALNEYVVF